MSQEIKACRLTVPAKWGKHQWPCIRAAEHECGCEPAPEWADYEVPFNERDAVWLASEAALLYCQRNTEREATRTAYATCQRDHGPIVRQLIELAPHNTSKKTVPIVAVRAIWEAALGRERPS